MELVSRILDGSIPYNSRGEPLGRSFFGGKISQDDRVQRLEEVSLLQGCSRKQLKRIARISEILEVPADTVLARTGTAGNDFFLILDGHARVEVTPRKRSRLGPGQYFGEMSLLDGGPRSASVVAETPLRLLVIKRRDFTTLLNESARAHAEHSRDALPPPPPGRSDSERLTWGPRYGPHAPTLRAPAQPWRFASVPSSQLRAPAQPWRFPRVRSRYGGDSGPRRTRRRARGGPGRGA